MNAGKIKYKLAFGTRIYLSMIALILLSLVIIGASTHVFFKNQNDIYHLERLKRKEQSLMLSLNYFVIENQINEFNPRLERKIQELAQIHNLDLNIYRNNGDLLGSTQEQLYDNGILSKNITKEILDSLNNNVEQVILQEEINEESYLSTYFKFYNAGNKPIGIINLPYHKDEQRNRRELNSFLSTLLQIYIILFLGASILAYFLSNYMTNSLRIIREKLKLLQIDKKNEKLEWGSNDEIGALVNDYNRVVDELEKSAELLAKSEREHAWKEMAKQVAHEIKNPLTPMRLSLQHFQRMVKDNPEDLPERFERFSVNMLEQIDTLSSIATEFSNFAKMPKANKEVLKLKEVIDPTLALFEQNPEVQLELKNECELQTEVLGDRNQLLRVLNNLVTNGVQAIPDDREGRIAIHLKNVDNCIQLMVKDNGIGITDDLKDKIFQPNFTTKSSGTGLGLAMVKNIIQHHDGQIWFDTELNKGTSFYIKLPIYQ